MSKFVKGMAAVLALTLVITTSAFAAPSPQNNQGPTIHPTPNTNVDTQTNTGTPDANTNAPTSDNSTTSDAPTSDNSANAERPTITLPDGEEVGAVITTADGEVIQLPMSSIKVTPTTDAENLPAAVKEMLDNAAKQIKEAKSLADIIPDIVDVLKDVNERLGTKFTVDQLVVRDLFDVTLDDEARAILENGGSVDITFDVPVAEDEALMVIHNYEGDKWETIPDDKVKVNSEDETVQVTFTSLSPIAFVVADKDAAPAVDDTEENSGMSTGLIAVIVIIIVAVAAYFISRSKKNNKK